MNQESAKPTPLREKHLAAGAKLVPFAGWEMPIQYTGILQEHRAVREAVGVFDISHMGEFFVSGSGAEAWLNRMLTNNVSRLAPGEGQYTLLCNEAGGVIDDLIIYRLAVSDYLLIVNASKIGEDARWLEEHRDSGIEFRNASDDYAAVAVQGPRAPEIYRELFGSEFPKRNQMVVTNGHYLGITGYTGEDGFEWFWPVSEGLSPWDRLLSAGVVPCGLGARDTLRLEMCYPLNGNDLSPDRSPIEAGLGFFVDLNKDDFIGREILAGQKKEGPRVKLAAIQTTGKTPPLRPHYDVFYGDKRVGETCSGALSPSLGTGIALAYLPAEIAKIGNEVEVSIRDRRYPACICKKPFYKKN
jgi:aminomethyltransferase